MSEKQVSRWLPRDEMKLLAYYFTKLKRPKDFETFKNPMELMKVLGYRLGKETKPEDSLELYRVMDANYVLVERGLAVIEQDSMGMDTTVSLTLEGRDLGRKYSSWFTRSGLRFAEYKHHWIWIIVAYVGGILSTIVTVLIVKWLTGNST